jgi:hypothetical protein
MHAKYGYQNLPRYDFVHVNLEGGMSRPAQLLAFLKIPSSCDVEETDWLANVQYLCLNTSKSRCHFPQYKWEMQQGDSGLLEFNVDIIPI